MCEAFGCSTCAGDGPECFGREPLTLRMEVVSQRPRAYVIDQFLSDYEADAIVAYAKERVAASTVGNADAGGVRASETRTSKNTWINRNAGPVFETLFRRAGDLLRIKDEVLTVHNSAEDLQVVNYQVGQKYDAHHDWGVNGYAESRYLTLLLYLNDMPHENAGGETAFPKGNNGRGMKIRPRKGTAALFYSLLPDGNGDDLSLHAALPVTEGEKWLANFWVWDPKKRV